MSIGGSVCTVLVVLELVDVIEAAILEASGVLMPDCEGLKEALLKGSSTEAAELDITGVKFVDT
jgi:hypothetical protein